MPAIFAVSAVGFLEGHDDFQITAPHREPLFSSPIFHCLTSLTIHPSARDGLRKATQLLIQSSISASGRCLFLSSSAHPRLKIA